MRNKIIKFGDVKGKTYNYLTVLSEATPFITEDNNKINIWKE